MARLLVLALLMLTAVAPFAAAAAGDALLVDVRRVDLRDADLRTAWRSLFASRGQPPGAAVQLVAVAAGDQALPLLCSRLLYDGGAWSTAEQDGPRARLLWQARDVQVRAAILRELRYQSDPGLAAIYERCLSGRQATSVLRSALVNLGRLDLRRAAAACAQLVDPRRQDSWPAAANEGARRIALQWLLERAPAAAAAANGLDYALLTAQGAERLAAVRVAVAPAMSDGLLAGAIARLLAEHEAGTLTVDARDSLVTLLARCRALPEEQVPRLLLLACASDRAMALPAAAALRRIGASLSDEQRGRLRQAIADADDLAVRHGLLALLLRVDPTAAREAAGLGSPWSQLGLLHEEVAAQR